MFPISLSLSTSCHQTFIGHSTQASGKLAVPPEAVIAAKMSKAVAYVAAAVVFIGLGALVAGLAVWYTHPQILEALTDVEVRTSS